MLVELFVLDFHSRAATELSLILDDKESSKPNLHGPTIDQSPEEGADGGAC